jgi:hypothetical protein
MYLITSAPATTCCHLPISPSVSISLVLIAMRVIQRSNGAMARRALGCWDNGGIPNRHRGGRSKHVNGFLPILKPATFFYSAWSIMETEAKAVTSLPIQHSPPPALSMGWAHHTPSHPPVFPISHISSLHPLPYYLSLHLPHPPWLIVTLFNYFNF